MATKKTVEPISEEAPLTEEEVLADKVEELVQRALKERYPAPPPPVHCRGCYQWTTEYNQYKVGLQCCSANGYGANADLYLCAALGFPRGNFFNGLAVELSRAAGVSIDELHDSELWPIDRLAELYDSLKEKPRSRPPTPSEKARAQALQLQAQGRDKLRALKGRESGIVLQIENLTNDLTKIKDEIEELQEKYGDE